MNARYAVIAAVGGLAIASGCTFQRTTAAEAIGRTPKAKKPPECDPKAPWKPVTHDSGFYLELPVTWSRERMSEAEGLIARPPTEVFELSLRLEDRPEGSRPVGLAEAASGGLEAIDAWSSSPIEASDPKAGVVMKGTFRDEQRVRMLRLWVTKNRILEVRLETYGPFADSCVPILGRVMESVGLEVEPEAAADAAASRPASDEVDRDESEPAEPAVGEPVGEMPPESLKLNPRAADEG